MAFRVASSSDYAKLQKTANKNIEGVSQWEQYFLQPLQESFETAGKQITEQTNYDISGAYANYKKQQLNLLQNQALGTGFKEQAGTNLLSQYQTAFGEAKAEETSKLTTLAQQYQKSLAEEESRLLKRGQQFADIEKAIYDFRGVDMSKLEDLGYYENIDGAYQLTEAGKDLIDETLNLGIVSDDGKTVSRFSDYIYETKPELYDFYTKNIEDIRELVGGLSRSDTAYSKEERYYDLAVSDVEKDLNEWQSRVKSESLKDYFTITPEDSFGTNEEKSKYYKEQYEKLTSSKSIIEAGSPRAGDITKALNISAKLRSGELKLGDIIEYEGSVLMIDSNTYKGIQYKQLNTIEEANDVMKSRGYVRKRDPWTDKWKWVKQ